MLTALVIPVSANLQASLVAVLSHKRTHASHQTEPQYLKLYPAVQRQFCYATLPQKTSLCNTLCPSVCLSVSCCLLYTSDAADEEDSVDLGGRRIIKKKK